MSNHPWLKYNNWAVVGASIKPGRYGHIIVKALHNKGYNTIPVSPRYEEIEGIKTYDSILEIDEPVDVVNFVVNPDIGIRVIEQCRQKGIKKIWLQPGTVSAEILRKAEAYNIEVVEACILVALS